MRLLIATGLYPPDIGGPATHTKMLEEYLPKHNWNVDVVTFGSVRRFPKFFRHILFFFLCLKKGKSADVILAQDAGSTGFPAMCAAKILRKPFVVRMSGDYAWEQSVQRFGVTDTIDMFQKKKYGFRTEFFRSVRTFVSRRANVVVTPSNYFKSIVEGWGIPSERVITIYNGIALDIAPLYPAEVPPGHIIVSAGRLVSWKGFDTLIQVVSELGEEWHLVLLGDGPEYESLQRCASENGVVERIHFEGRVTREQMFGWCKSANVFVLNTSFESFSFQIVEAMSAGVPVVTTHIGSLPELITDGVEGRLVAPDDRIALRDAILSTIHEEEMWLERVNAAQKRSGYFSIEHTVDQLVALFVRLST